MSKWIRSEKYSTPRFPLYFHESFKYALIKEKYPPFSSICLITYLDKLPILICIHLKGLDFFLNIAHVFLLLSCIILLLWQIRILYFPTMRICSIIFIFYQISKKINLFLLCLFYHFPSFVYTVFSVFLVYS